MTKYKPSKNALAIRGNTIASLKKTVFEFKPQ